MDTTKLEALKPCDHCGGEAMEPDHDAAPVYCRGCGLRALDRERWNRRTRPATSAEPVAWPVEIGRRSLGAKLSDGERLCNEGHQITLGHPLYWHPPMGQYDDSDPCCLEHAIEEYASEQGWPASPTEAPRLGGGDRGCEGLLATPGFVDR